MYCWQLRCLCGYQYQSCQRQTQFFFFSFFLSEYMTADCWLATLPVLDWLLILSTLSQDVWRIKWFGLIPATAQQCTCNKTSQNYFGIWRSGSTLGSIKEVTLQWARVISPGFNVLWGKPISVYNQPPRSTQPGHPSVCRRNWVPAKRWWCCAAGE